MMHKAPTDRAAVPERLREGFPLLPLLILAAFTLVTLYLVPALEASAQAYRAHTEEMVKQRRCEDTTQPITRPAAINRKVVEQSYKRYCSQR